MHKFAHLADAHLGAHREPNLQRLELHSFDAAMAKCVEAGVDFVLICGDLFHVGIPDLGVVDSALKSMMRLQKHGIPIYAIYGSHDYTPNGTSVIDILNTAGILTNLFRPGFSGGGLKLPVFIDEKTGAKLAGISARKIGLESRYYDILDRASLEAEDGFKVFAFHSGITELKPEQLSEMETVGIDMLPRGFDYYAGGHIHQRGEYRLDGHDRIVFPGPLFTGYGRDLEETAKGERRGFYLVEFDDRVRTQRFVPVDSFAGVFREYDATGRNSGEAGRMISDDLKRVDVDGKLVVIRVYGVLAGGKPSDIDFGAIRAGLVGRGAIHAYINRNSLTSKESSERTAQGLDPAALEKSLLRREVGRVSVSSESLRGERGAETGAELLRLLRQQAKLGESKRDYTARMVGAGKRALGIEGMEKLD
ncbi:MAG: exonuclease SbcCD subunit D [Thaumarchaeota archaeon]|nr:exonuclease SbcCD subunit D [Nitrososphaerota archaeon]